QTAEGVRRERFRATMPRQIRGHPPSGPPIIQQVAQSTPHVTRRAEPVQQQQHRPAVAALLDAQPLAHRPTWGGPTWPPPPPAPPARPRQNPARPPVHTRWPICARLLPPPFHHESPTLFSPPPPPPRRRGRREALAPHA